MKNLIASNWTIGINFRGSFHAGCGYAVAGRADKAISRDRDGRPYVPGSTLKGRLRHAVREIAYAFGEFPCGERVCSPEGPACIVCRVFGSVFRQGALFVSDAQVTTQDLPMPTSSMVLWGERHGIGVNRTTRTAQPGLLYSMECAPDGLRLTAKASGCLAKADSEILKSATKSIVAMGGSSSRGLGRCECQMV